MNYLDLKVKEINEKLGVESIDAGIKKIESYSRTIKKNGGSSNENKK